MTVICPTGTTNVGGVCEANAGACGTAATRAHTSQPSSNLCSAGTASAVSDITAGWEWQCVGVTSSVTCNTPEVPDIDISADPELIRRGDQSDITATIDADWNLTCSILNAKSAPITINHTADSDPQTYVETSQPLYNAQIVTLSCPYPPTFSSLIPPAVENVRVEVVPTFEEI